MKATDMNHHYQEHALIERIEGMLGDPFSKSIANNVAIDKAIYYTLSHLITLQSFFFISSIL